MGVAQVVSPRAAAPAARRSLASFIPTRLDGLRLGLFLLIIINVSRVHQAVSIVGKLRPALLLVLLSGLYALANPAKVSTAGVLKTTEGKIILWLFFTACLSAVMGISLGNSGKYLLDSYVKVVIGAFLLLAAIRHVQDLVTLVWGYVLACGILAYMATFMFTLSRHNSAVTRLSNLYTFDANDIGVVFMVGLPLTLLLFQHSAGLRKWLSGAIIIAIGVALARSGSRGALLGLVGTGMVLLIALKTIPVWKRAAFVGAVGLALVLAAPPGYWDQMKTIIGIKEDYNWSSEDGRRQLIMRGFIYMQYYPIAGVGINNFERAECMSELSAKVRAYVRGTGIRCTAPHNTYIQAGAETGYTGLILFLALVFGGIWRMRKLRRKIPRTWRGGDAEQRFMYDATLYMPVAMVGFAITSFFVSFAWIDIVYILAVFMAGLTIAVRRRMHHDAHLAAARPAAAPTPPRPAAAPVPLPVT